MELKMKYHYSYFIYPFVVKNYNKYVLSLMASPKYTPKFFEPAKDVSIYNYFLPSVRDYMFKSFGFSKADASSITHEKLRENSFKESPCAMFSYNIGEDAQAKTGEDDGIFFKIDKMEVICFKTGICFLVMKTNIQGTDRFSDFLNFNAKFREISSEIEGYDPYNNIKIQTSTFDDIKRLSDIIREITGGAELSKKIDIDVNKFLIYSYVCIDQEYWNGERHFSDLEKEFFKLSNVLSSDFNSSFKNYKLQTVDFGEFIKVGVSRAGTAFFASSINTVNYTHLPFECENEYLYTYIFTLYQKFYLSKLLADFKQNIKVKKAGKDFANFTNDVFVHEITNNDNGILLFDVCKKVLGLQNRYEKTKEQYDVMYKKFKMQNSDILNKVILALLAVSIVTNIVNFVKLFAK